MEPLSHCASMSSYSDERGLFLFVQGSCWSQESLESRRERSPVTASSSCFGLRRLNTSLLLTGKLGSANPGIFCLHPFTPNWKQEMRKECFPSRSWDCSVLCAKRIFLSSLWAKENGGIYWIKANPFHCPTDPEASPGFRGPLG